MIRTTTIVQDFGKHSDHDEKINSKIESLEEDGHQVYGVHFEHMMGVSSTKGESVGVRLLGHIIYESVRRKKE